MFSVDPMTFLISTYVLPTALATCSAWSLYVGAMRAWCPPCPPPGTTGR